MFDDMLDNPFGNMFDENQSDYNTGVVKPTQYGQLPVIPETKRAASGFVGLMNQYEFAIILYFFCFFNFF